MQPMYSHKGGRVLFRGRPLDADRCGRILALHRQSAARAVAEGLTGLAAAALALAGELEQAMAKAGTAPAGPGAATIAAGAAKTGKRL